MLRTAYCGSYSFLVRTNGYLLDVIKVWYRTSLRKYKFDLSSKLEYIFRIQLGFCRLEQRLEITERQVVLTSLVE